MKWLWRYMAHEDPLAAAGNSMAIVLGYNTPFYPAYLYWVAGPSALPWALLTWCVCPFFLLVPAIARNHPLAARIMLPVVATANTVFCTAMFGEPSGTEIFLFPCVTLTALLFRPAERVVMLATAALPLAAFFLLSGHYGAPPHAFTPAQAAAVLRLNAGSAGTLGLFMGLVFARVYKAVK